MPPVPNPRYSDFQIGGTSRARRIRAWVAYTVFIGIVAAAFVYLFFLLTLSWQIAIGSVTLLIGYMAVMAWWTERHAGSGGDTMR